MNILCVSHTPDLKGSAVSLCELMKGLDPALFKPVAAFSKDGTLVSVLEDSGISTHVVGRRGFLRLDTLRGALHVIDTEKIDLVHVNSAVSFSKYFAMAARWRRLPVVWHVREDPWGKRLKSLKKWIAGLSTRIVVLTSQQEEAFRRTGKVIKIYNGVDTTRFRPDVGAEEFRKRFQIPEAAFVFGMVGSIEENKGTLNFLKAAQRMSTTGGNIFFAVVGGGLPEDVRNARRFARQDPFLASRTIFTGKLAEIPQVMCGLDVLVVASRWESFPRVLLESMACGKPAIAPAVGEIPRIMDADRTGILVCDNRVETLHEAMERCVRDKSRLREMGRAALERVRGEFTIETHVGKLQEVYAQVLGERKRGR